MVGGVGCKAEESIGDDGRTYTRCVNGYALVSHKHCGHAHLPIYELCLIFRIKARLS